MLPKVLAPAFATAIVAAATLCSTLPASAATPTGWTEVANDAFTRADASSWGSADLGGAYSTIVSKGASIATTGSAATATMPVGTTVSADLKGVSATDIDFSDSIALSAATDATYDMQHRWVVRQQADGSAYSGRIRIKSTGSASLGVNRLNGSASTWLGGLTLPFTVAPGQVVRGEIKVTGTSPVTVQARAWIDGTDTPDWQFSYTDSDAAAITQAGYVGVSNYTFSASSPLTITHDDLSVGNGDGVQVTPPTPTTPPVTPPTTPPPTPIKPTLETRGAPAIGSTSYTIPAGAFFVDPVKGSDTAAGTLAAPFKTVAAATVKAPSGATLVLRAGTYHESVAVTSKSFTIQNYPGEAVWFDGSKVISSWTKSGTSWVTSGWTAKFGNTMGDVNLKARFLDTNPLAANPDQVFVDGQALWQVGSASAVTAGKFYVDYAAGTIRIGTDPTGKQVRASDLAQALVLSGANTTVQGIGVRRYANGYELSGALRVLNTGGTVRDVVVEDTASVGIGLSGANKLVDHVTVKRAGLLGFGATKADNSVIQNSIFDDNNTQDFKDAPVSGGAKMTSSRTITVKNNQANNNGNGSGIWFDSSSYDMTIVSNTANGNGKYGIEVEVSAKAIVANNVALNSGDTGIIVFDASDVKVFNNEVGGSKLYGIKIAQDNRRQAELGTYPESRDPRNKGIDPTITWIVQNIEVSNNVFGSGGVFQLFAMDGSTNRAVDTWNMTANGNLFTSRTVKTDASLIGWGKGDNVSVERYDTTSAFNAAKNVSVANVQGVGTKLIDDMGADKLALGASAVALPSDVAAAIGIPAGSQQLGTQQ